MLLRQSKVLSPIQNHLIDYPTPVNISYLWSFGSLAGLTLIIQIITGIFLVMNYVPNVELAFDSVEHIMRNVHYRWLLRYMHANGAAAMFIVLYIHIGKGLYYGSYLTPRQPLWFSGVTLFILTIITAFLGYCLPWRTMSLWRATVITNLIRAVPIVGDSIVLWLWGGFSVDNPTLNRFFSLHYLMPFLIAALSLVHLYLLHIYRSSNPIGVDARGYSISFYPYLYTKDLFVWVVFIIIFGIFVFFVPNVLRHPDNYIPADPLVTPPSIVPEFYLLPFYAILRSIPSKLGGVIAMAFSLIILYLLPYYSCSHIRSRTFRPIYRNIFWLLTVVVFFLRWLGSQHVEPPFVLLSQIATILYFRCFVIGFPFAEYIESYLLHTTLKKHS